MASYSPVKLAFRTVVPDDCELDKAVVIFIHGLSASKEYWMDIPEIVADGTRRKVYVIDSRNHGDSEWSDEFSFDCNVDDLLNFMDEEGVQKAILIAHSMGGLTAIKTALRVPERIEKIIIEDVSVRPPPKEMIGVITLFLTLSQEGIEKVPAGSDEKTAKKIILQHIGTNLPPEIRDMSKKKKDDMRIPMKINADGKYEFKVNIPAILKALKNPENLMTEPTGIYENPALFIHGLLSPFKKDVEEPHILKLFPNAKFVGIEDATHTVHNDCALEFTEAVLEFL
ncbi:abhydrolase domain-containing protein C22H12.03 [Trichonephila clavata]|uniref:sn-1-specific diacylglycerol lipase ABHD11 n=1 Tax=Trichonephila clavata TaxID=2740835 RepID=A0A8X6J0M9_TRICU|nr:abhydrolase domain-containing protein C22H12.03 [Trichonephila clavata]